MSSEFLTRSNAALTAGDRSRSVTAENPTGAPGEGGRAASIGAGRPAGRCFWMCVVVCRVDEETEQDTISSPDYIRRLPTCFAGTPHGDADRSSPAPSRRWRSNRNGTKRNPYPLRFKCLTATFGLFWLAKQLMRP